MRDKNDGSYIFVYICIYIYIYLLYIYILLMVQLIVHECVFRCSSLPTYIYIHIHTYITYSGTCHQN